MKSRNILWSMNYMDYDNVIKLITAIFEIYIIFRYMNFFYKKSLVSKYVEYIVYGIMIIALYISSLHVLTPIDELIIIFSIITFVSLFYDNTIHQAIFNSLMITINLFIIHLIIALLDKNQVLNFYMPSRMISYYGSTLKIIFSYLFLILILRLKNIQSAYSLPTKYYFGFIFIPFGITVLMIVLFTNVNMKRNIAILCLFIILIITFIIYYLYDHIIELIQKETLNQLYHQQQSFYEYQYTSIKENIDYNLRLKHDMKNKLNILYSLANNARNEEIKDYIVKLGNEQLNHKDLVHSGNEIIDMTLNYKLYKVNQDVLTLDILVPENLEIDPFDLTTILGNVLDNAIEGMNLSQEPELIINIKYSKGMLLIKVVNSFDGIVIKENNKYKTRKEDKLAHGIGLESIKMLVNKYDGLVNLEHDNQYFKIEIVLYA